MYNKIDFDGIVKSVYYNKIFLQNETKTPKKNPDNLRISVHVWRHQFYGSGKEFETGLLTNTMLLKHESPGNIRFNRQSVHLTLDELTRVKST